MKKVVFLLMIILASRLMPGEMQIDITEQMPVELLLHTLGRSYGENVVVSPGVKGTAPILTLKGLSFEDALETITASLGFVWEKKANAYVVKVVPPPAPEPERTEVFIIRHISPESVYEMLMPLAENKDKITLLKEVRAIKATGSPKMIEEMTLLVTLLDTEETAAHRKAISIEQYTPQHITTKAFLDSIKPYLSEEGVKYEVSEQTKTVSITATVEIHNRIVQFLQKQDTDKAPETAKSEPVPQVSIESQFVEFSEDNARGFEVDWQVRRVEGVAFEKNSTGTSMTADASTAGNLFIGILKQRSDWSFVSTLNTYIREGKANILVAPKTSAMNNETAVFKYTREYNWWQGTPYFDSEGKLSRIVYSLGEPVEVNISLEITPEIDTTTDTVTVMLHPVVQDVLDWVSQPDAPTIRVPNVAGQETTTKLRIKNGETIAIGGLKRERENNQLNCVPVLGYLPLLGKLFRTTTTTSLTKSDLIIFLTVKIMESPESVSSALPPFAPTAILPKNVDELRNVEENKKGD
jgi:type II secretory pathway component GspD/PulD (secretin)